MLNKINLYLQIFFFFLLSHCGDPIESCVFNISGTIENIKGKAVNNAETKVNRTDYCCPEDDLPCIYKANESGYWFYNISEESENLKCSVTISKDGYISKTEEYVLSCPKPLEKVNIELYTVLEAKSGTCIDTTTNECTEVPEADCIGEDVEFTPEESCPE